MPAILFKKDTNTGVICFPVNFEKICKEQLFGRKGQVDCVCLIGNFNIVRLTHF